MRSLRTFKEKYPKTIDYLFGKLATVARYHLAAIFILSGVSKAIDPFGLSIKIGEYFNAMGLGFMQPLSTAGSILLPGLELLIGLMLLTGVSRRLTAWLAFVSMTFFTLLTLWLAIANPISDCGCFGDLVHLSNWQTFFKNLIFYPFAITFFLARNAQRAKNPDCRRSIVTYVFIVPLSFALGIYSFDRLPLIDPTPYKIGTNIPHAMAVHDDNLETTLIYRDRETGKLHDFSIEDTTWYDHTRWEYVDTRTVGNTSAPAIKSLPMFDGDTDRSAEILQRKGYTLLFVVNRFDKKGDSGRMEELAAYISAFNGRSIVLSAQLMPAFLTGGPLETMSSDNTVLRTMIQHRDGGALLLHDGTIIGKWPMSRLPEWNDPLHDPMTYVMSDTRQTEENRLVIIFSLVVALLVILSITKFINEIK